jgi:hypothetical protein
MGLDGGVRSLMRTGLHWNFPVNTEKSEIRAFSAHFSRSKPLRRSAFLPDTLIQLTGKSGPRTANTEDHAEDTVTAILSAGLKRIFAVFTAQKQLMERFDHSLTEVADLA